MFEGADRSGKTTQTKRYADFLRKAGVPVAEGIPWRFPDRSTGTGQMIDAYLKSDTDLDDHTIHLLFAANRWEKRAQIIDALNAGQTVIIDRYAYSGVAYSTAKGLPIDWCKAADAGLPAPDVVIYLDLSIEAAQRRGDFGKERYENIAMQQKVADIFKELRTDNWRIIDADADEEAVFIRIVTAINEAQESPSYSEKLRNLWIFGVNQ